MPETRPDSPELSEPLRHELLWSLRRWTRREALGVGTSRGRIHIPGSHESPRGSSTVDMEAS